MSTLAVGTGVAILAWVGLVVLLVIALVIVALFNGVVRPAREIKRYTDDILEAGVEIATNLDGVDELARTRDLATALPGLATAYLEQVKGKL